MREIKFKIFDNNKLYAYATLGTGPGQRKLFSSPNLFQTLSFDCYEHQLGFDFSQEIDKYALMQFTGLIDKNGKEIYEGDICYKKGYGRKCVIRFNEEWLKYEAFYGIGDNGSDLTMGLGHWNKRHCDICNEQEQITEAIFGNTLEVIGNIYENPELLTK